MINLRFATSAFLCAVVVVGCGSAAPPTATPSAVASLAVASQALAPATARPSSGTPTPTLAAEKPCGADVILGMSETMLTPGTQAWVRPRSVRFPVICFEVADGWESSGRFTFRVRPGEDEIQVSMQFWDVGQVYGHPCKWRDTLFDPGPTVDDLAEALVDIPLRNASEPVDVTLGGYSGKYVEWSVPKDIGTGTTEQEYFASCDTDPSDGQHYFESWVGDPAGWGGDRYHQGPGQVDRVWILDVDGVRFVIDAFSMPTATQAEIDELVNVLNSITFEP